MNAHLRKLAIAWAMMLTASCSAWRLSRPSTSVQATRIDTTVLALINETTLSLPIFDEAVHSVTGTETVLGMLRRTRFADTIGFVIEGDDVPVSHPEDVRSVRDLFEVLIKRRDVLVLLGRNGCVVKSVDSLYPPAEFPHEHRAIDK